MWRAVIPDGATRRADETKGGSVRAKVKGTRENEENEEGGGRKEPAVLPARWRKKKNTKPT